MKTQLFLTSLLALTVGCGQVSKSADMFGAKASREESSVNGEAGALALTTPPIDPARGQATRIDILLDRVTLFGKDTNLHSFDYVAGQDLVINDLKPGRYNLVVSIFGNQEQLMLSGDASDVEVRAGEVASAVVKLEWADRGGINVELELPTDEVVEGQGLVGDVFLTVPDIWEMPNYDEMTPDSQLMIGNLDIPTRSVWDGFPGRPDLNEWYGIRFKGRINIPTTGECSFKTTADDIVSVSIDGESVIAETLLAEATGSVHLSKGWHDFRLYFYQGPEYDMRLQLSWKCANHSDYEIVPASAFAQPLAM